MLVLLPWLSVLKSSSEKSQTAASSVWLVWRSHIMVTAVRFAVGDGQGCVLTPGTASTLTHSFLISPVSLERLAFISQTQKQAIPSHLTTVRYTYIPLDNKLVPFGHHWWQEFKCKQAPQRRKAAHRVSQDFPKRAILTRTNSQSSESVFLLLSKKHAYKRPELY